MGLRRETRVARSERLLELIQVLRRHRHPVSGQTLSDELGVSLRTIYRDVQTLIGQGASIEGEAGVGYILKPGFMLPPLMFSDEEIEALVLGSRWVARRTDERLAAAASSALAKISAVLPAELREIADASSLLVSTGEPAEPVGIDLGMVRRASREETKLDLLYRDAGGATTDRLIWPFALGFFERVRVIAAWCELRADMRHFRADRILRIEATDQRYPRRRR